MGNWSDPIYSPGSLSGLLDRYFQYRFELHTTDPYSSAVLLEASLVWDQLGIEGSTEPVSSELYLHAISPNPSQSPLISFGLTETACVELCGY